MMIGEFKGENANLVSDLAMELCKGRTLDAMLTCLASVVSMAKSGGINNNEVYAMYHHIVKEYEAIKSDAPRPVLNPKDYQ